MSRNVSAGRNGEEARQSPSFEMGIRVLKRMLLLQRNMALVWANCAFASASCGVSVLAVSDLAGESDESDVCVESLREAVAVADSTSFRTTSDTIAGF